jgi:hypothetical protein
MAIPDGVSPNPDLSLVETRELTDELGRRSLAATVHYLDREGEVWSMVKGSQTVLYGMLSAELHRLRAEMQWHRRDP